MLQKMASFQWSISATCITLSITTMNDLKQTFKAGCHFFKKRTAEVIILHMTIGSNISETGKQSLDLIFQKFGNTQRK